MTRPTLHGLLSLFVVAGLAACSREVTPPAPEPPGATSLSVDLAPTAAAMATPVEVPSAAPDQSPEPDAVGTRGLIRGTVADSSGAPIADAAIIIVEGTSPWPEIATYSSAKGAYQWLVEAGTYTLEASRDGFASTRGEVAVSGGQEATLDFTLGAP